MIGAARASTGDHRDQRGAWNSISSSSMAEVFQRYSLARGEMMVKGRRVDPAAIRRTALFTV